jgi:hypothetical protein
VEPLGQYPQAVFAVKIDPFNQFFAGFGVQRRNVILSSAGHNLLDDGSRFWL